MSGEFQHVPVAPYIDKEISEMDGYCEKKDMYAER